MKPTSEVTQCVHQPSHYIQIHQQRHLLLTLTAIIFMLICEASAAADQGAFYVNEWGSERTLNEYNKETHDRARVCSLAIAVIHTPA
jgi:hypothetical protein